MKNKTKIDVNDSLSTSYRLILLTFNKDKELKQTIIIGQTMCRKINRPKNKTNRSSRPSKRLGYEDQSKVNTSELNEDVIDDSAYRDTNDLEIHGIRKIHRPKRKLNISQSFFFSQIEQFFF